MRRRALTPLAVVLGATLALAGCASSGGDTPDTSASPTTDAGTTEPATPSTLSTDVPAEQLPTATGEFGDKPELTFPSEDHLAEGALHVISEGDGDVVEAGDLLVANYLGQVWGGEVFDNSYDRGAPSAFQIGVGYVVTGWDQGLVGQKLGSRVLLSLPPDLGYGAGGNSGAGIGGEDTIVFVVDLVDAYGADAAGQADAEPGDELPEGGPVVEGELGGPATISLPDGATEPTEQSAVVIARGTGDVVAEGDSVIVHYALVPYDGTEGYSSWAQGAPEQLPVSAGSPLEPLAGVPVGSRVVVTVPKSEAQSAWVYVMDIIAIG